MEKKPINMKPLAMVGMLAASFSGIAADGDNVGTVTFRTATEATVEEVKGLNFGNDLSVTSGTECEFDKLLVATGASAGEYLMDASTDDGADFKSTGCGGNGSNTAAQSLSDMADAGVSPGIFKLKGVANQTVVFKIQDTSNEFLKFEPVARYYAGSLDEFVENDPMPGKIENITAGATTDLPLGTLRSIVQGQPHNSAVGTLLIAGKLTTLQRLETSKDYELTYSLDVTYK
ncbi:hypothetical protein [Pseudoalteromonas denitrificans]|uniref:Uncharacterized protein n=1 Tax=Pseudoalteromonas denitrificans DSM 6059 TaxID=1123010 RepID=A0A1I1HQR3_9GAMM|nr:hypothetical protein [Pseudoalteromonas denitrificans]SFC25902.1 hypothetical protein SAMN02745724_01289 [Pseudoalteromonas denitrificans DSM 6059]